MKETPTFIHRQVGKRRRRPADKFRCSATKKQVENCGGLIWERYKPGTQQRVELVIMTGDQVRDQFDPQNNKIKLIKNCGEGGYRFAFDSGRVISE